MSEAKVGLERKTAKDLVRSGESGSGWDGQCLTHKCKNNFRATLWPTLILRGFHGPDKAKGNRNSYKIDMG
jgi:hypothetical protein